jgi:hypothetical protein
MAHVRTEQVVSSIEDSRLIIQPLCKADPHGVLLILILCKEYLPTIFAGTDADDDLLLTYVQHLPLRISRERKDDEDSHWSFRRGEGSDIFVLKTEHGVKLQLLHFLA